MLSSNTNGLVGLIVIETAGGHDELTAAGDDATLGQILRRLARGAALGGRRFSAQASAPNEPLLVAADCQGLGAELEQATRQLRRRMSAAERIGL